MFKSLLTLAFTIPLIISGCSTSKTTTNFSELTSQTSQVQTLKNNSDWYSKLRPELQSYYSEAKGLKGEDLFYSLKKIISRDNKITTYSKMKGYMYEFVDNVGGDNPGIIATYSDVLIPGSGSNGNIYTEDGDVNKDGVKGDFINCEHVWPQSFFGKSLPMRADMHHLQATLSRPNNRRATYPFGEVGGGIKYSTSSGSKLGNSVSGGDRGGRVFEPSDTSKGNIARSMMYFFMRYSSASRGSATRGGKYRAGRHWYSNVELFEKWSLISDKVDAREIRRNDGIFEGQGNRNPFIDVPEFVSLIGADVLKKL